MIIDNAFKSRIVSYRVKNKLTHILIENFLSVIEDKIIKLIQLQRDSHTSVKVNMELYASYSKDDNSGNKIYEIKSFNTKNVIMVNTTDITDEDDNSIRYICRFLGDTEKATQ